MKQEYWCTSICGIYHRSCIFFNTYDFY